MTIQDYETATRLLQELDDLETNKVRVNTSVILSAEGSPLNEFIDFSQLLADIITEIDSRIATKQAEFDAL